ncbi:DUF896 domain-containing protein [Peptococcaceae bacterium 1198_IL3148]
MITKELVDQINALARKQKSEGLTAEEKQEQDRLRKIYLAGIRQQVIDQLGEPPTKRDQHGHGCSCGCGHHHHHKH